LIDSANVYLQAPSISGGQLVSISGAALIC
jgi:hypothetical protein